MWALARSSAELNFRAPVRADAPGTATRALRRRAGNGAPGRPAPSSSTTTPPARALHPALPLLIFSLCGRFTRAQPSPFGSFFERHEVRSCEYAGGWVHWFVLFVEGAPFSAVLTCFRPFRQVSRSLRRTPSHPYGSLLPRLTFSQQTFRFYGVTCTQTFVYFRTNQRHEPALKLVVRFSR